MLIPRLLQRRCFAALLLALPLLLLVGVLRFQTVNDLHEVERDCSFAAKVYGTTRYDILIVGSSRVHHGFSPQAMQTVLPDYRIYNFGFPETGLNPAMYTVAEQRLDWSSDTPVIILGVSPMSFTQRFTRNMQYNTTLSQPKDVSCFLVHHAIGQGLLTFVEPTTVGAVRKTLTSFIRGRAQPQEPETDQREFHPYGWESRTDDMAPEEVEQRLWTTLFLYHRYFSHGPVRPDLVQALVEQTRTWSQCGVSVFAVRMPGAPAFRALEDELSGFDEAAFRADFEAAGGIFLSVDDNQYVTVDGYHLEKQSAWLFSRDIATMVQSELQALPTPERNPEARCPTSR